MVDRCKINFDIVKTILYESYLPIDALVFEIGTSKMSKSEVNKIIDTVLEVKGQILQDQQNLLKVFNLSETIKGPKRIKKALEKRQKLISKDDSFILKELIKEMQDKVLECAGNFKNQRLSDPKLDNQYRSMINRVYDAIYENQDIQEVLRREKDELFQKYRDDIPEGEFKRTRIALSLGNSVFSLSSLVRIISKINLKEKRKFLNDQINVLFEGIEELAILSSSKSFVEQKALVKEYIKSNMEMGPSNSAFEFREAIITAAKLNSEEIKKLSAQQSKENMRLLEVVENMRTSPWIIKYNKEIKEDLIVYLLTQQPEDKKKVLNHF
ncbi:hypothetical protein GINT2_000689 [Glugoides intestinalis]